MAKKRLRETAFSLKAGLSLTGADGVQGRVKGFASRGRQPFAPKKNQTISNNG
jgi:hypothetical protein